MKIKKNCILIDLAKNMLIHETISKYIVITFIFIFIILYIINIKWVVLHHPKKRKTPVFPYKVQKS